MRIVQEKERIQYASPITNEDNQEFLEGKYFQEIRPMNVKQLAQTSEENDTIFNVEEIPVVTYENISQEIYEDGSFYYESQDVTPDDMRFVEYLSLYPQPEEERVAKTVINDNYAYLYNSKGELLSQELIGDFNFKSLLDSVESYVAADSVPSGLAKVKMMTDHQIRKAVASGMRLLRQDVNEIVFEMNLGDATSSLPNKVKSSIVKRAVIHYSYDMNQVSKQKVYEGDQLVQSVEYEYAIVGEQKFSNKAAGYVKEIMPSANVKMVKVKSLNFKHGQIPYIMNTVETYKKNQITFNFKNN